MDLAEFVHDRWHDLGRKIKPDVKANPDKYSLIYMKEPFIVPGGRFREVYYWDSYWTIIGLLISGMTETAKGMLENFADLIDQYGLIPNGNRIYYTRRSQPPLYIAMVEEYYKVCTMFLVLNTKGISKQLCIQHPITTFSIALFLTKTQNNGHSSDFKGNWR